MMFPTRDFTLLFRSQHLPLKLGLGSEEVCYTPGKISGSQGMSYAWKTVFARREEVEKAAYLSKGEITDVASDTISRN